MGVLRLRGGADEEKKPEADAADDDDDRRVNLMSQEGDQFEVEVKVAKIELVKTMIPEEATRTRRPRRSPCPTSRATSWPRSSSSAALRRGAHVRDREAPQIGQHARGGAGVVRELRRRRPRVIV